MKYQGGTFFVFQRCKPRGEIKIPGGKLPRGKTKKKDAVISKDDVELEDDVCDIVAGGKGEVGEEAEEASGLKFWANM